MILVWRSRTKVGTYGVHRERGYSVFDTQGGLVY